MTGPGQVTVHVNGATIEEISKRWVQVLVDGRVIATLPTTAVTVTPYPPPPQYSAARHLPVEHICDWDLVWHDGQWVEVATAKECDGKGCPCPEICGGVLDFDGRDAVHHDALNMLSVRIPSDGAL